MNLLTRLAAAAVIVVIVGGGAILLLQRGQPGVGTQSPAPGPQTPAAGPSQTPGLNASPSVVPARAALWTVTGTMVTPRMGHTATLLRDGRVLVAGGSATGDPYGGGIAIASAELYDPATGTWAATGNMTAPRIYHSATLLRDGRVLVAGDGTSAELYDPTSGTWTATGDMVTPHGWGMATLLRDGRVLPDGRVLVAGGVQYENDVLTSAQLYDPASGTWTATGSPTHALYGTATLLGDGEVLVVGGGDCRGTCAELYDPASKSWTDTSRLIEGRSGHTATLLPDGEVLVAGGGSSRPTAELYDPTSGTWTATGDMKEVRSSHTATLLPDGRVLVAGGDPDWAKLRPIAELYDPASRSWTETTRPIEAHLFASTATLLPDGTVLLVGGQTRPGEVPAEMAGAELYRPAGGN